MSVNLLDLAKGYLTDELVGKAASFLGESSEATKSGMEHAVPALLGGLMNKAGTSSGASDLLGMVTRSEFGGDLLSNLGGLFSGSNSGLMNLGGSLLGSIFGNKLGGVTDLITNAVGLKSGTASGLLKMALPMLMGVISKKVGNSGISGLTSLLSGQKDYLEKAAPAGFLDKMLGTLGVGSLGKLASNALSGASNLADNAAGAAKNAASNVSDGIDDAARNVKKGGNKMLPLLALLALAAIIFFAMRNCKGDEKVEEAKEKVEEVATDVKEEVKEVTSNIIEDVNSLYNAGANLVGKTIKGFEYLGEFVSRKLSDGTELIVPSKGFESQLVDFIESDKPVDKTTWFDMRRVLFKTGSADLDERSMKQIDYVAAILKAYPNVNIKIGGYTDNTGDATFNKTLSGNRAASVMKALIAKGIDAGRLSAEGYGQEHPIADNATEEGRQLNRRVSARVTKK